ncbi:ATP-binding SpoIIE family protein phosphatase [Prauserella muralis]|uniref:Histidine kinase n=1 Tax=Prauserella muralis TaxID=588067 RepID=A0A2V4B7G2_9PSEU|nr:SpoIIE family protein phosphatase [Prauserella muralis]PXY31086.1 histidine kinase [Prauserella muralis]TWE14633.1 serine phosphatase RsbU (regulator of sigma subunit) [Prauserella muralis]
MSRSVGSDNAEERLRRIEAVTDTTLAHLAVEELLEELLKRVRDILDADTATVLLVDGGGQNLIATASSGIEEEVRQGVRIRVGRGFAGRIAARREPLVLERVSPATVANPLLWQKGIQSLAGVPLVAGGELLGVLHIGRISGDPFTSRDVELLQLAADRVALATRARRSHVERAAASALQRSLLPARLPRIPGLELSARYAPGEGGSVSGDWYDVFTLPSGWLCVAIGDVVGRGLTAATVMSRMRTAMRSFAIDSADPSEALSKADRHVRHFEPQTMATIAYAMWEPSLERMHLSLAGHLAPVMAPAGGVAALAEVPIDPPVGVGSAPLRRNTTVIDVPPGATVLFYTDGLVERRHRPLDAGLKLLRDSVVSGPTETVCSTVMARLVGNDPTDDDIAVLALRRQTPEELRTMDLDVDAVPESLSDIRSALRRWLPAVGASEDDVADLLVVVGEACANAVEHAYGPRGGPLNIRLEAGEDEVRVTVKDSGNWREPRGRLRGKGTQLMRQLSDELHVEHDPHGTTVHIRRRLAGGDPP